MSSIQLLIALCGTMSGGIVGVILGFSMASHPDVMRGVRPRTANRFILFIARPTQSLSLSELAVFAAIMAIWLAIFFMLVLAPGFAAQNVGGGTKYSLLVAYGFFVVSSWVAHLIGARAWRTLT